MAQSVADVRPTNEKKKHEDDYVFIVSKNMPPSTPPAVPKTLTASTAIMSFDSIEEAPTSIPFLPLDASTEITKHGGYTEAVAAAQEFLDSRLEAYTRYQEMVKDSVESKEPLLTPRSTEKKTPTKIIPVAEATIAKDFIQIQPLIKAPNEKKGKGWKCISSVDDASRKLLRKLEQEGVLYTPHDTAYSVTYLSPVDPYGDCLFLSVEQLLKTTPGCANQSPQQIRHVAAHAFWEHYSTSTPEEQKRIDSTIRNLYFPDLKGGWGISRVQAKRYVAPVKEKDMLIARVLQLQEDNPNMTWDKAAESVYSMYAEPVACAQTYCRYIAVGNPGASEAKNADFLISINYTQEGLISVDNDQENNRVSWGDDIVLESLASHFRRDIFVVLVGGGRMFFLPHRPNDLNKQEALGLPPWFLLMRATGTSRGGDHYEPMYCSRLRGDASPSLGCIGE